MLENKVYAILGRAYGHFLDDRARGYKQVYDVGMRAKTLKDFDLAKTGDGEALVLIVDFDFFDGDSLVSSAGLGSVDRAVAD